MLALLRGKGVPMRAAAFAAEAYRTESLVGAADRDPLDILLRRTSALLTDLRARPVTRDLAPEQRELESLRREAASVVPASQIERRALFDRLLRCAAASPLPTPRWISASCSSSNASCAA